MRAPRDWLLAVALLAPVGVVYSAALAGGLLWDDGALIQRHPAVLELGSPASYFGQMFWANPEYDESPAFYRPLTILSYALQVRAWGLDPLPLHLFNLLVHLASCALLFLVCRQAGAGPGAAGLAALLFGTLPRLSECVAWISGRTDLLAGLGVLAAWRLHRSEPGRWGRRLGAAGALAAGLFCKEVAAAGGAALSALELERWRQGLGDGRRALRNLVPAAGALALYAGARGLAWQASGARMRADLGLPWEDRPWVALQALGTYLGMLADPLRPRVQIGVLGQIEWPWVALGTLGAAALAWGFARLVRGGRSPHALAAATLAAAALLPVLHLVTLPVQVVAADRYLYVPAAGLAVLGALGAGRLGARARRITLCASLVLLAAFGATTARRAALWADELAFWRAAAAQAPAGNAIAHAGLGEVLLRRERHAEALEQFREAQRRRQALADFFPASAVAPEYIAGNLAFCLAALGRYDEALAQMQRVVEANPGAALNRFNLALIHAQRLEFDAAERALAEAFALYPAYPRARGLAATLALARSEWESLPPPRPDEPAALQAPRARAYTRLGNHHAALPCWIRVLEAPDASPEDLRRAAVFLVLRGEELAARRALARLRALPALRGEALELEHALTARLGEARG